MKNKYTNERASYFSTPRIHGNVFAWNKPAAKAERSKPVTETIQRWEDDGGPVSETARPPAQAPQAIPVHQTDTGPGKILEGKI